MITPEENDLLCRVVGDAPMGQLMRRHWTPVCLSEEVPEADGTPVKARVFGEDLVVFRDSDGQSPKHTFFYPLEDYDPELLDRLGEL